ncbi:MAG: flagellar biosynthetic protein FliQ [Bryobacterales bacterium]|nr:flagellar biosynthetic protein FliQ [Bryobacterales bacterium]
MTPDTVSEIIRQCLWTAFWVGLPILSLCFIVGAIVSLIQVLTSMQDSAFNTIPRLLAFFASVIVFLPWTLERLITYCTSILGNLEKYAR